MSSSRRQDAFVAIVLFVVTLTVYLKTLCPTLYWGDCGELAAAAYTLGIAHPTGYPVWCLLGKLWTLLLPVGTIIWRLNVFSAVCGAAAVTALYGFGRTLRLTRPVAVAVAGLLAFSHTFWQQCLFCETYSLTAFYTCLLLYLAARWRAHGCPDTGLRGLAVAYGFALTNHQTNALFLPGFLLFLNMASPRLRNLRDAHVRRVWASAIGLGFLPLLSYAYLPLWARLHPGSNWGDTETLGAFLFHVTGGQYRAAMFSLSPAAVWGNWLQWAHGLGFELTWAVVGLAALGLALLWRPGAQGDYPLASLLTWIGVADVVYAINYGIYNRYIYYIPCYIVLCGLAGLGWQTIWRMLEQKIDTPKRPAFAALAATVLLAAVPFQAAAHWGPNDLSATWACYDYGRNILRGLPSHALLVCNGDDTNASALHYLQRVEGFRRDVIVVQRGLLNPPTMHQRSLLNIWHYRELCRTYPEFARLCPPHAQSKPDVTREMLLREIVAKGVQAGYPVAVIEPGQFPPLTDSPRHDISLQDFLAANYQLAQIGLPVFVYAPGRMPSQDVLLAQMRATWGEYQQRGVYDGLYLTDDFLQPLGLDYANGNLIHARLAMAAGRYDEAADAYRHVLRLFQSAEATAGLARCTAMIARSGQSPTMGG